MSDKGNIKDIAARWDRKSDMYYTSAHPGLRLDYLFYPPHKRNWFDTEDAQLVRQCHWGRDALWLLGKTIAAQGGVVALPSYLCHSVLDPIKDSGANFVFYQMTRRLEPVLENLVYIVKMGVTAIVVIHYNGLPQRHLEEIAQLCHQMGIFLIEDCSEYLGSENPNNLTGKLGHATIYNFRKFLPVPDFALLVVRDPRLRFPEEMPSCTANRDIFSLLALMINSLRSSSKIGIGTSAIVDWIDKSIRSDLQNKRRRYKYTLCKPTSLSRKLVNRINPSEIRHKRQHNFHLFLNSISDPSAVLMNLLELNADIVPRAVPTIINQRDEIKAELARKGIETSIRWPLPIEVSKEKFPNAHWVADRILVLPCHQDLSENQIRAIAKIFSTSISSKI